MIVVGAYEVYKTINEALSSLHEDSEDKRIYIKNGIYHEKVVINVSGVTLIGEDYEHTILTNADYAKKIDAFGQEYGTFRTSTLLILSPHVRLSQLTIRNDAGRGELIGQAVALFVNADDVYVDSCQIIGCQDTLLTGPIPMDAKNQEHLDFHIDHDASNHQYFNRCLISGDVDFIFGSANALFRRCKIVSNDLHKEINGYISAPSTEANHIGHVFYECQLISEAKAETVYLGRPWREYANCVYIDCFMGPHIHRNGFAKWENRNLKSRFFEYGSYGLGAFREDSLSQLLMEKDVKKYLKFILNVSVDKPYK